VTSRFADLTSHAVSAVVPVPARSALAFLSDAANVDTWTLGSMHAEPAGPVGVYVGRSLFDGSETFFAAAPDPARCTVDYLVGSEPDHLVKRIAVRVDSSVDHGDGHCVVTLMADRPADMDDARWHRVCACHEVEILLLEQRLVGRRP